MDTTTGAGPVLAGLMQDDFPLTLAHPLERMRSCFGAREIVTLEDEEGRTARSSYAAVCERVDRLANALRALGVQRGDRVATFAWNSQRHFELYFAVPCAGAVLHTANIRLSAEQILYTLDHAGDRVVFVDASLVETLAQIAPRARTVETWVVMGETADAAALPNAVGYEELLAAQPPACDYPRLDERAAAALCYTSGTTGPPKGVLYSHRSITLHAAGTLMADSMAISSEDRILSVVPMFHVNAWGVPFAAALSGAQLVMPSRFLSPQPLARLIERERCTVMHAVPTLFADLLRHAREAHPDLSSLRNCISGGAAVPKTLMQALEAEHGAHVWQAWGMTETSPVCAVSRPPERLRDTDPERYWELRACAGRIVPLVEARVAGEDGAPLPAGDARAGELQVRGPWVARAYFDPEPDAEERFADDWLRTGDIACLDAGGWLRITDRAKDVIKSGGEWISSVELECELVAHPLVAEAAVVAIPDERWSERPLACIVPAGDEAPDAEELATHLRARVPRWWVPERFVAVDALPHTSTGKLDKKRLRAQLADGTLATRDRVGGAR